MRRLFFVLIPFFIVLTVTGKGKQKPATVILTAGQSNTDGRVMNTDLPGYIQENKYNYCKWSYGSAGQMRTNGFELFWPQMAHSERPGRWAFDAVTYYWLEQDLQEDFYVIKWSLGGTAIDTAATSTSSKYWSADPEWLSRNHSTATGGQSLLLSFIENIETGIDNYLSQLENGYEVKAFLWHQGEADRRHGKNYYNNLKGVVQYVRDFLVEKTGEEKYNRLPFICGTVPRKSKQYNKEVETALYQLAEDMENFFVVDMSEAPLQKDEIHLNAESAEYLGLEVYKILAGLDPPNGPPNPLKGELGLFL